MKKLFFLLCFFSWSSMVNADGMRLTRRRPNPHPNPRPASSGTFDVRHYGARGNGRTDDSKVQNYIICSLRFLELYLLQQEKLPRPKYLKKKKKNWSSKLAQSMLFSGI